MESRPSAYNMEQLYDPAEQITGIYNSTGYNNGGVPYWWGENVRLGGRLLAYNICCEYREVFLHKNALGTTTLTMDHGGNVLEDQLLYPWGQMWTYAGQLQGYGFAGLDYTNSTGMYPTLNRMYTTTLGRWMSPDPLAGDISNPQSLNRYAYALNNPTTLTDPTGLDTSKNSCLDNVFAHCNGPNDAKGSFDNGCLFDNIETSCAAIQALVGADFGVVCPGPCEGFGTNAQGQTKWVQFYAFAGGVSGYFNGADLTNGINILNGMIATDAYYQSYMKMNHLDQLNAQLAYDIGKLEDRGVSFQDALASLGITGTNGKGFDEIFLQGGNFNFPYTGGSFGCLLGRCDSGLHFHGVNDPVLGLNGTFLHGDTEGLFHFPFGPFVHAGVDVFLGSVFYDVIPRH